MKNIVSISLGASAGDYDFTTRFREQWFRVRRFGTDHDVRKALDLLARWQGECDAIGLGMVSDHQLVGTRRIEDPITAELEAAVSEVPVTTGARLRSFLDEWTIRHIQEHEQHYFTNARVLFLSGLTNYRTAQVLSEYTHNMRFADPLLQLGVPKLLRSIPQLDAYAGFTSVQRRLPNLWPKVPPGVREAWTRRVLRKPLHKATVIVAPHDDLAPFGLEELAGKIVLTSAIPDEQVKRLGDQGVDVVIDRTPKLLERVVGLNVIEAMIVAALGRQHRDDVLHDEYLEIFGDLKLQPRILFPSGRTRRVNRFAFVIHPLSREYLKASKPVELASRIAPSIVLPILERLIAYSPPFVYSRVTGIKSPTGVEAEGWLITVGGTPKELLAHSPEFTYRRLLDAAKMAERLGAQIMGLGAFTKVVGDAGVTVARRASIPITTGNSYSASGALWAAADAVKRMGLLSRDERGKVAGKAMVVGATGAIGSVCARLLAMAFEEVHLVSPEIGKLLTLREAILADTPDAILRLSSQANENLRDMDLIVTATSGAGKKILDIMKVKPGCVITDVARPLDLPPSEVAKRPDVLVIESGEIQLPGDVQMRDIGLPKGVVYACLAETIVLALEGRFETYTVGRNIQWEKVKEIYKLGLKHGMRLAAISGVEGPYSDEDIRRVRDLALAARAPRQGGEPPRAGARERGRPAVEPQAHARP
ncbi:dehydrogenase [Anaeromyxobacter oryzae]|uniref:Serine carboxypeptidase n=1 Tax=Anaeromyxobacter oryzae TaxID=2918170 RepID=A0ABM7WPB9_9BACT|nr:dehydrogenase [Anaeromyxobacter oryzae]BDG01317.1 serine carboxypeptidase [Anaeromyxobacter oryzae]